MKFKKILTIAFLSISTLGLYAQDYQSLSGSWRFGLDKNGEGVSKKLTEQITLPGTTDEAHYGDKTVGSDFGILTREYKYYGAAWYERDIVIPATWKDKRVWLKLERVMWESKVYLDGKEISVKDALNSPHLHDLGYLTEGKHTLKICINNDMIYNIGDKGHVYTEYTQSIWNGAVGEIALIARNKIHLTNPQVFTKISPLSITIKDEVTNESSKKQTAKINYTLKERLTNNVVLNKVSDITLNQGINTIDITSDLPKDIKLWSDMSPELYVLDIAIIAKDKVLDSRQIEIGIREVTAAKSKILINGKPV
ncbi:MAG: glycoside hydrolase family 2, partial [Rikenellaceae bacterium]